MPCCTIAAEAPAGRTTRAGWLLLALAVLLAGGVSATLRPEEELGKRIFRSGEGAGGREIPATLGTEGVETTATTLPCAGCHGRDGRGRPEGGVAPPDVTWAALTRPYSVAPNGGRLHPPYTERLVKRAVTLGLDAAGNPLDRT